MDFNLKQLTADSKVSNTLHFTPHRETLELRCGELKLLPIAAELGVWNDFLMHEQRCDESL